jgi:hypothetical protein
VNRAASRTENPPPYSRALVLARPTAMMYYSTVLGAILQAVKHPGFKPCLVRVNVSTNVATDGPAAACAGLAVPCCWDGIAVCGVRDGVSVSNGNHAQARGFPAALHAKEKLVAMASVGTG